MLKLTPSKPVNSSVEEEIAAGGPDPYKLPEDMIRQVFGRESSAKKANALYCKYPAIYLSLIHI